MTGDTIGSGPSVESVELAAPADMLPRFYAMARRLVRGTMVGGLIGADDLAAGAMLAAIRAADRRGADALPVRLLVVGRRAMLEAIRREGVRQRRRVPNDCPEGVPDRLAGGERFDELVRFAEVPFRDMLHWRFRLGESWATIGASYGVTGNAVKQAVRAALARMGRRMHPYNAP